MSAIEKAAAQMEAWAVDNSHGYDQTYRWGEKGDFDCSAAIIQAWEQAGVPVKSNGATYTGNMYPVFMATGFEDVTASVTLANGAGLQRGDVLLNHVNHTAMYVGGGKTAEASINEMGTTTGGTPGDQTDKEFLLRLYRNYPWDCVLRFTGKETEIGSSEGTLKKNKPGYFYPVKLPLLKEGMEDSSVMALQAMLKALGYLTTEVDGNFGAYTRNAVIGFQAERMLDADGEVGGMTWAELINNYGG